MEPGPATSLALCMVVSFLLFVAREAALQWAGCAAGANPTVYLIQRVAVLELPWGFFAA